ncbi:hypothetical protein J6590_078324 [Homalodisca vitripennis]|nr:hypothetical protein J6590_078324 [Homalodisca vitripennis]
MVFRTREVITEELGASRLYPYIPGFRLDTDHEFESRGGPIMYFVLKKTMHIKAGSPHS